MPKRGRETAEAEGYRGQLQEAMFEDIPETATYSVKKKNFGPKKSRKPRKLGKLSLLKKELKTARSKSKLAAQRAETDLAQLERRKSKKLVWAERQ